MCVDAISVSLATLRGGGGSGEEKQRDLLAEFSFCCFYTQIVLFFLG